MLVANYTNVPETPVALAGSVAICFFESTAGLRTRFSLAVPSGKFNRTTLI